MIKRTTGIDFPGFIYTVKAITGRNRFLILCALTIVGALIFTGFWARQNFSYNALNLELKAELFKWGKTVLSFPPIGEIEAKTHLSPFSLKLSLQQIDVSMLNQGIQSVPRKEVFLNDFSLAAKYAMKLLAIKVFLLAVFGGCLFIYLAGFRKFSWYIKSAAIAACLALILLVPLYLTYSVKGFNNPKYIGILEAAPWVSDLASEGLTKLQNLGNRLQSIAGYMQKLLANMEDVTALTSVQGDLKILHVSDIHNNPAVLPFLNKMVKSFNVDLIIDTGDITDFGTALEASLLKDIERLNVPYYFVPGNHDSADVVRHLKQLRNVRVINGETTFRGFLITGRPDPASLDNRKLLPAGEEIEAAAEEIAAGVDAQKRPPDLFAVHNPALAGKIVGKIPLLVHGHDHRLKISSQEGTIIVGAGTTGAAGIRGLSKKGIPYSVVLLHFKRKEKSYNLMAIDAVKIYGFNGKFVLDRHVIDSEFT